MVSVPYEEEYMGHTIRVRPSDGKLRVDGVVLDEYNGRVFDQQLLDEIRMQLRNKHVNSVVNNGPSYKYKKVAEDMGANNVTVHNDRTHITVKATVKSEEKAHMIQKKLRGMCPTGVKIGLTFSIDDGIKTVKEAKDAYVNGDLNILELEKRLEDVIEIDRQFY